MGRSRGVESSPHFRRLPPPRYTCGRCRKVSYASRKEARAEAKRLRTETYQEPGSILCTYKCPVDKTRWHVGHDRVRQAQVLAETRERTAIPKRAQLDI